MTLEEFEQFKEVYRANCVICLINIVSLSISIYIDRKLGCSAFMPGWGRCISCMGSPK
jgi:hypothetical protein